MMTTAFTPLLVPTLTPSSQLQRPRIRFPGSVQRSQDEPDYFAEPDVTSTYAITDAPRQGRFENRVTLTPLLNLSLYSFNARVDFMEIKAKSRTQVSSADLSKYIWSRSYIRTTVSGDAQGKLIINVKKPMRWHIKALIKCLNDHPIVETEGEINAIQVSLQANADRAYFEADPTRAEQERWALTELLSRHFLPPSYTWDFPGGQPRSVYDDGIGVGHFLWKPSAQNGVKQTEWSRAHTRMIREARDVEYHEQLEFETRLDPWNYHQHAVNGTTCFGNRACALMFKVMHRIKDTQDLKHGKETILDNQERRACVEATLRGDALRRHSLTHCSHVGAGLRKLRKELFKFWLPTVRLTQGCVVSAFELERFQRGGVYAVRQAALAAREREAYLNRRVRGRRFERKWRREANDDHDGLQAFSYLNKRCADALRRAEGSWARLD
ncbi:hypothetical protein [Roseivivax sediminis]|uniref:Uncharacterized protein n=1 Tax=Roseivivax sediminis TaxID=936889 RepID=A0A1I2ELN4_9RHOB|nr:hypothetical protein [Roseivivax sediminis]SFE93358.1 hypothetical protein SAMN04515678_12517 [Roseivivax sediminis]